MPRNRDETLLHAVGQRVAEVRKAQGWTQERLSEAVGLQAISLSRLENGARALSLSTLARIADVLEVGLGDLLDVERPMPAPTKLPGETELLRLFRGLDEEQRDLVVRLTRDVAK